MRRIMTAELSLRIAVVGCECIIKHKGDIVGSGAIKCKHAGEDKSHAHTSVSMVPNDFFNGLLSATNGRGFTVDSSCRGDMPRL
jgi:hypothetical protein